MASITPTYLAHEMKACNLTLVKPTSAAKSEKFDLNLGDCSDDVLLVMDATGASGGTTFTANIAKGVGPAACGATVNVTAGSFCVVKLCTAAVMNADGKAEITVSSSAALNTSGLKITALKKNFVTNY